VKKSAKRLRRQMNLSLLNPSATILADDKQEELTLALIALLINGAAQENDKPESEGGSLEFEAHA
jgi:hypothetical protein